VQWRNAACGATDNVVGNCSDVFEGWENNAPLPDDLGAKLAANAEWGPRADALESLSNAALDPAGQAKSTDWPPLHTGASVQATTTTVTVRIQRPSSYSRLLPTLLSSLWRGMLCISPRKDGPVQAKARTIVLTQSLCAIFSSNLGA